MRLPRSRCTITRGAEFTLVFRWLAGLVAGQEIQSGLWKHGEALRPGARRARAVPVGRRRGPRAAVEGDLARQPPTIPAIRVEPLRDREHHLPVRHGREPRGIKPRRPEGPAFRVAAGAEVPSVAPAKPRARRSRSVAQGDRGLRERRPARDGRVWRLLDFGRSRGATVERSPCSPNRNCCT